MHIMHISHNMLRLNVFTYDVHTPSTFITAFIIHQIYQILVTFLLPYIA